MTIAPLDPAETTSAPSAARGGARALGGLLWRRRWIALVVFAVVCNVVVAGLVVAEREYTASARVAATPSAEVTPSPASYSDLLGTVADVAQSRPLLEEVASRVPHRTAAQLREEVRGDVISGTVIVQVSVTDPDPELAAQIANLVAELLPEHDPSSGSFEFKVVEEAVEPDGFSSPNLPVSGLAGLAVAVLLAVAAAAAADRLLRTVSDPEEMGAVSETAVLGIIPKPEEPEAIAATSPRSPEFQALRALRIAIEFASVEDPSRLLVVTSAGPSEPDPGWLEANVAVALADVGHRVLVVNADRDARIHPALHDDGEQGLYDVLAGSCELGDAVMAGPAPLVDVLPLGQAHLAAPSLLEMRFRGLLDETEGRYDVVIVHAPPVASSEDARIMAIHGALVLTVPSGQVHPRHVRHAAEHLRVIRLRVLGTVLVGVRPPRRRRRPRVS